jgi:hypothetical protein
MRREVGSVARTHLRVAVLGAILLAPAMLAAGDTAPPKWEEAKKMAHETLRRRDRREHDLLSQADAQAVVQALAHGGWEVADGNQIVKKLLPDNDAVVVELRTHAGVNYMRQISKYPKVYDCLDHFVRLPRGQRMLHDMTILPDGYKLVEYLTTTSGGKNLGAQLSQTPRGANFNQPTGKIYTAEQLLAALKTSYDAMTNPPAAPTRK